MGSRGRHTAISARATVKAVPRCSATYLLSTVVGGGLIRLSGDMYIWTGFTSVLFFLGLMVVSSSVGLGSLESVNEQKIFMFEIHKQHIKHKLICLLIQYKHENNDI